MFISRSQESSNRNPNRPFKRASNYVIDIKMFPHLPLTVSSLHHPFLLIPQPFHVNLLETDMLIKKKYNFHMIVISSIAKVIEYQIMFHRRKTDLVYCSFI